MTQATDILHHMRKKPITPLDALHHFGCLRLGARIFELRRKGHAITKTMIPVGKNKHVARYVLIKEAHTNRP